MVKVEARGPSSLASDLTGKRRRVVHVAAEAGWTDERAVATGKTPLSHLPPSWVIEVTDQ